MNTNEIVPEVGMGATELMWTDRHAYTIVEVVNERRIIVQQDIAVRIDKNGMSESQEYAYSPNVNAEKLTMTRRKDGSWRIVGERHKFAIGVRREYHDYSF